MMCLHIAGSFHSCDISCSCDIFVTSQEFTIRIVEIVLDAVTMHLEYDTCPCMLKTNLCQIKMNTVDEATEFALPAVLQVVLA